MPDAVVLISLALFTALLVATIDIVRRMGRLLSEARESETFRAAAADLITRVEVSLDGLAGRIDAVRRHQIPATEIEVNLDAAADAVRLYTDELGELQPSPRQAGVRDALRDQLARADRAIDLVRHACGILGEDGGGFREQEAQTSIKRAYLNILHAREAIDRSSGELERASETDQARWLIRRRGT